MNGSSIENIHKALQAAFHEDDANEAQGSVVTGWAVVAESMEADGTRFLCRLDGNAGGERLTSWQRQGLLHNALNEPWPEDFPDDDDEA